MRNTQPAQPTQPAGTTAARIHAEVAAEHGDPEQGPKATNVVKLGSGFDLQARIAELIGQHCPPAWAEKLAREESANMRGLSIGTSVKKAASVYGLGRFPVTLYKGQWLRLIGVASEVLQYLEDNDASLAAKGDSKDEQQ